jgi:glycine cleavage system T protein (aminomethyltransferase)
MKQSPLYNHHMQLGATFEEVSGWTVPAHYGHVAMEHAAVRHAAGLSDLSHRGKIRVTGDDRIKWLQSLISNDILTLQSGQGRYSSFLTHKGKMLGYFRVYIQPDVVWIEDVGEVGDATFQALRKFLLYGTKAKMENCLEGWGLLLVSGPKAAEIVSAAFSSDVRSLELLHSVAATVGGQQALIVRTEETGEQDFALLVPVQGVPAAWEQLMASGAPFGIKPVGAQAREALRIEAGLPKAGPDLNQEIVPPEANLEGKAFSLTKGCYPGQEVVARMDTYGNVRRHLVGLVLKDQTIPPLGAKLFSGDREVGWISSAAFSPQRNAVLAFGFPLRDFSSPGTALAVEMEGARHPATVHALPFYVRS